MWVHEVEDNIAAGGGMVVNRVVVGGVVGNTIGGGLGNIIRGGGEAIQYQVGT